MSTNIEEIMNHPRTKKLQEWSRGHIAKVSFEEALEEYPGPEVRQLGGWSEVWPRPSVSTWEGYEAQLEAAQQEWDRDNERSKLLAEDQRKRDQAKSDAEADRKAQDDTRIAAEAAQVKEDIKRRYLSMPGASEAEFEAAYPDLLADHRRKNMPEAESTALNHINAF